MAKDGHPAMLMKMSRFNVKAKYPAELVYQYMFVKLEKIIREYPSCLLIPRTPSDKYMIIWIMDLRGWENQ